MGVTMADGARTWLGDASLPVVARNDTPAMRDSVAQALIDLPLPAAATHRDGSFLGVGDRVKPAFDALA